MASNFRQEMPPSGGYKPIDWAKKIKKPGIGGYASFAIFGAISTVGFTWYHFFRKAQLLNELEMTDGRLAMEPFLIAERQRAYLKQLVKNREEEKELMKDVPGWEVGTLYGTPVYHHKERLPPVNAYEYYIHSSPKALYDRVLEKRKH